MRLNMDRLSVEKMRPARLHHRPHEYDPYERDGNEDLPPQPHDLVVAIARESRANPQKDEQDGAGLEEQPANAVAERMEAEDLDIVQDRPRRQPAAEEHDRAER